MMYPATPLNTAIKRTFVSRRRKRRLRTKSREREGKIERRRAVANILYVCSAKILSDDGLNPAPGQKFFSICRGADRKLYRENSWVLRSTRDMPHLCLQFGHAFQNPGLGSSRNYGWKEFLSKAAEVS